MLGPPGPGGGRGTEPAAPGCGGHTRVLGCVDTACGTLPQAVARATVDDCLRTADHRPPSGTAFWHLVYDTPDATAMRATLDSAFTRGAGHVYATDDELDIPWDAAPGWGFATETAYAATKG